MPACVQTACMSIECLAVCTKGLSVYRMPACVHKRLVYLKNACLCAQTTCLRKKMTACVQMACLSIECLSVCKSVACLPMPVCGQIVCLSTDACLCANWLSAWRIPADV